MGLITIKESHNVSDLAVLKSKLQDLGIESYLKNELSTQVLNHIQSNSVELQIEDKDLEKVKLLGDQIEVDVPLDKEVVCPKCGSSDLQAKVSYKLIGSLLTKLITLGEESEKAEGKYRCTSCSNEFYA